MNEVKSERDCVIYCIKSNFYGKMYVGSTKQFASRINNHIYNLKHGQHRAKELQKTFDEFGIRDLSFSILEYDVPNSSRYERENYWIDILQADDPKHGYNTFCTRENTVCTFYKNVRLKCAENKITVWQLANRLKMSHSAPHYWRKGRVPNTKTVKKIADYFGVSIEELLKEEEDAEVKKDS